MTVSSRNRLTALIRKSGYQVRSVSLEIVARSTRRATLKRIYLVTPAATGLVGLHKFDSVFEENRSEKARFANDG
jgi:hypothetical protein